MIARTSGKLREGILTVTVVVVVLRCISVVHTQGPNDVCNALPEPTVAFRVVWNHPDTCQQRGFPLDLQRYGIVVNAQNAFAGDQIKLLYRPGEWPKYDGSTPVFGGLPQLMNDTHFPETRRILEYHQRAFDNFHGLGIIDWEDWRAAFDTNFYTLTPYKLRSKDLVRSRNPDLNETAVTEIARHEWDEAARRIMSEKLHLAQEYMPNGYWGYYDYPRSYGENGTLSALYNDKLPWLWEQATGLYPSIYLYDPYNGHSNETKTWVRLRMEEAVRIQATYSRPNTVIYPYALIQVNSTHFFPTETLQNSIRHSAKMGADGVVLWGSSELYKDTDQCVNLQTYIQDNFGPYVVGLLAFTENCSATLCHSHGRCIRNNLNKLITEREANSRSLSCRPAGDNTFARYHCRCYAQWQGDCCQTRRPCQRQRLE